MTHLAQLNILTDVQHGHIVYSNVMTHLAQLNILTDVQHDTSIATS